ncbi:hypothetical protein NQ317_000159 [Molorchus minor]|uniref:Cytokine-like nuclear factor N-PAC n=1 Tax=Molorchus minor TaxID=1323400 RepID=A0ABQ9JES9_9CUCU|nr:hypothetical protein NQ317_000159 [Molorchus minor]
MENNPLKVNDFVWSKITGHPPWPSLIVEPIPEAPEKPISKDANVEYYWVYFFGDHNYAWVEHNHVKPFAEYKDKFASLYKTVPFKEALAEIEKVLAEIEVDVDYQVDLEPFKKKKPRPKRNSDSKNENNIESAQFGPNNELLRTNNITTSHLTFGLLGTGIIGSGIVKNLIRSGHKVYIWNRTTRMCTDLVHQLNSLGVGHIKSCLSPRAVVENSDIIFNCVSDHNVSKKIIQNYFGINNSSDDILNEKGFVEMTSIDPETSKDIRDMIEKKGGRYLEAQLQGSKLEAETGSLVILTAGNQSLFFDCQSCFKAIGKSAIFVGDVGYATKINLILQLIKGVSLVGLVEGLGFAERCGVSLENFLNIFNMTNLSSAYLKGKSNMIMGKLFSNVEQSLQNMQKDMKLGLDLSNHFQQPMEMASLANEIFKHGRRLGFSDHDVSCIYLRTKL